ncbi:helix-turn-helix domain-containing protein [uncultured Hymenobacter sp.]|uniref:helix-turn-helix domain-containing protein n=1 Tax=uncultured Hymenobacter sp. TaxID=170016 RepID=UPI0035C98B1F
MDRAVIPIGVAYAQLLEDVRAVIRHELNQISTTHAGPPPADELLSIREAAELLGVTVQTIHSWKQKGLLKYHKLGSRSYLKRANVSAALQSYQRTVKTGKGGTRA